MISNSLSNVCANLDKCSVQEIIHEYLPCIDARTLSLTLYLPSPPSTYKETKSS
jgi:hypothetical protein